MKIDSIREQLSDVQSANIHRRATAKSRLSTVLYVARGDQTSRAIGNPVRLASIVYGRWLQPEDGPNRTVLTLANEHKLLCVS